MYEVRNRFEAECWITYWLAKILLRVTALFKTPEDYISEGPTSIGGIYLGFDLSKCGQWILLVWQIQSKEMLGFCVACEFILRTSYLLQKDTKGLFSILPVVATQLLQKVSFLFLSQLSDVNKKQIACAVYVSTSNKLQNFKELPKSFWESENIEKRYREL